MDIEFCVLNFCGVIKVGMYVTQLGLNFRKKENLSFEISFKAVLKHI